MNKIKEALKKSSRFFLGLAIGLTLSVGIGYAATVAGSSTTYNKNTSGLSSTNVQAAIDELYTKAKNSKTNSNIVKAYTYSSSCTTGTESACQETTCYKTKSAGACAPGTIIDYKVNNNTQVRFHVIQDDGATMTLQSQKNTLNSSVWYSGSGIPYNNSNGPTTALGLLEIATAGWTNVKDQTYSIGGSSTTLGYSGCSSPTSCSSATYSLTRGPVKARMITVQEAVKVGCSNANNKCPIWLYNYLRNSTNNGGTADDSSAGNVYWTMSAYSSSSYSAWNITYFGSLSGGGSGDVTSMNYPVRAVVAIDKSK